MEKPNRAERRKSKFGGGRSSEHGGWPEVAPNPVFHADPEGETPTSDATPAKADPKQATKPTRAKKTAKTEDAAAD
jgi:hypothetical protein